MNKKQYLELIINLIKEHKITAYEIAKAKNISSVGIQNIINGVTKNPNQTTLDLILSYIDENIVGVDLPISSVNETPATYHKAKISKDRVVPFYDIEFSGSHLKNFSDVSNSISFYVDYEPLNDCTAFIPYAGDSMLPKYKSGDALGLKEISNFDVILWGESHFVITNEKANSIKTVKNIHQHKDQNKIILRSINPDYLGDTVIEKDHISSMFIVKGKVELNQI